MKFAALCSLLIISLLCQRCSSASLMANEMVNSANQITELQMEESDLPAPLLRTKRYSHISICTYCCNCCKHKGCGLCCRT